MQELRHLLIQEQKRLETIINKARSGLESAPEGHLRISCDKNINEQRKTSISNSGRVNMGSVT